jgi:hypothetical protein
MPLVVEPLCCAQCAWLSTRHCPHLKRRIDEGAIVIRQVFKFEFIAQQLNAEATLEFCGVNKPGIIGHLKMALTDFKMRDHAWLERQQS